MMYGRKMRNDNRFPILWYGTVSILIALLLALLSFSRLEMDEEWLRSLREEGL